MPDGLEIHLCQGTMEPDKRVLKDIVGRLPSPQARVAPEHLAGEFQEPFAGVIQEKALRSRIARSGEINQALELCVRADRHRASHLLFSRFWTMITLLWGTLTRGLLLNARLARKKGHKTFVPLGSRMSQNRGVIAIYLVPDMAALSPRHVVKA